MEEERINENKTPETQPEIPEALRNTEDGNEAVSDVDVTEGNGEEGDRDILIQELSDVAQDGSSADEQPEDEEDEGEKFYCIRCEREVSEYVTLCDDCERIIKKYPFHARHIVPILLILFLSVFGLLCLIVNLPIAASIVKGDIALRAHRINDCYSAYDAAYAAADSLNKMASDIPEGCVFFTNGNRTFVKQLLAVNELNGPYYAGQYIGQYFGTKVPSRLAGINEEYNLISSTYEKLNAAFEEYYKGIEENGGKETLEGLLEVIDKASKGQNFPEYLVSYFKFLAASAVSEKPAVCAEYMDKLISENPDATWLYGSYAIELYKDSGDLDKALSVCNRIIQKDPTNAAGVAYAMSVLRLQNEFDNALKLYEVLLTKTETTPELERQRAIILMLDGKCDEAQKVLEKSYDLSTLTVQYAETLCACSIMTGDTEKFDEINALLEEYQIGLSDKISDLKAGKITLEDIYMKGRGESV